MIKRCFIVGLLVCFFSSSSAAIDEAEASAEELYSAALYARAAELYKGLLLEDQRETWQLRLSQCLFYIGEYQGVIALLENSSTSRPWKSYLLGTSFSRTENYQRAIEVFKAAEKTDGVIWDEMRFEEALANYLVGDEASARPIFENLAQSSSGVLPRLYLARIDLEAGNLDKAKEQLITTAIDEESPLRYEREYLLGEAHYQTEDFEQAISHFRNALPSHKVPWAKETLYHLGWSYLKEAERKKSGPLFSNAEETFNDLLELTNEERGYLALGQAYLLRAKIMRDESALSKAEEILTNQSVFISREGKSHALLLRAQAAPTHAKRDTLYRQLTHEANSSTSYYGKGWYLRGLNDFEEGEALKVNQPEESRVLFERAANSFKKAIPLLDSSEAALALQLEAQSYMAQENGRGYEKALLALTQLLKSDSVAHLADPAEAYYLHALTAAKIEEQQPEHCWSETISIVKRGLEQFYNKQSQHLLGILQYRNGDYREAEQTFIALTSGDALFWAAKCADALGTDAKKYRRRVYEEHPDSQYAAEAYFTTYSYKEYLQGGRAAIKHLEAMPKKYPESPFILNAYYLIGMDYKRDRKSPEGKWLRKRDLNTAIESFHQVETTFDEFQSAGLFPVDQREYFVTLRYYATLERALCNLAVAEESEGAKRQIFLEYAEDVFQKIVNEFKDKEHPLTALLRYKEPYPQIEEESTFWLAKTYLKAGDATGAEKILNNMWNRYKEATITRGYFLSRMWYEQGQIALGQHDYTIALKHFQSANDASKGKVLSTDERLDLWIQQSRCYRGMKDYDNAILILTKVTNEDVISSLRLKAMFLRAELYDLQNRPELARNQLKALAKKGGDWAHKAIQTLEERYGY